MLSPFETWGGIKSGFPAYVVSESQSIPISIIDNGDGTFHIVVPDTSNALTVTFVQPARLAGAYALSPTQLAELDTTPVNLAVPVITGPQDPVVGAELSSADLGFWFSPAGLDRTFQWYVDGVPVDGATDPDQFTTTVAGSVALAETLGGVTVVSDPIVVASASSFAVTAVDDWSVDVFIQDYTRTFSDLSAGDDFIVVLSSISSSDYFTSATLAGVAGTRIAVADQGDSEYSQVWQFTGVTAGTGDLVLNGSSDGFRRMSFQLVAAADYQVIPSVVLNTGTDATATITTDVLTGDVALVTFGKEFGATAFTDVIGFAAQQNVKQNNRPAAVGWYDVTVDETTRVFSVTGNAGPRNVGVVTLLRAA